MAFFGRSAGWLGVQRLWQDARLRARCDAVQSLSSPSAPAAHRGGLVACALATGSILRAPSTVSFLIQRCVRHCGTNRRRRHLRQVHGLAVFHPPGYSARPSVACSERGRLILVGCHEGSFSDNRTLPLTYVVVSRMPRLFRCAMARRSLRTLLCVQEGLVERPPPKVLILPIRAERCDVQIWCS